MSGPKSSKGPSDDQRPPNDPQTQTTGQTAGRTMEPQEAPPPDTGTLGDEPAPASLGDPPPSTANPINDGHHEKAEAEGRPSDEQPRDVYADVNPGTDRRRAAAEEGIDPRIVPEWNFNRGPAAALRMAEDIERHAARSHGLSPDVELLKKIAAHLRATLDLDGR